MSGEPPMENQAHTSPRQITPPMAKEHRARSLPSASPFRVAVFFSSLHYLGWIATITTMVSFYLVPCHEATEVLIGCMVFCAITWLIAFFKRRNTFCPLCKGTPLMETGARVHVRAKRIFPCNHGVSATLTILATQKFRCMYCGSDYDLLKPPSRAMRGVDDELEKRASLAVQGNRS